MRKPLLLAAAVALAATTLQLIAPLSASAQFNDLIAKHVTAMGAVLPDTAKSNSAGHRLTGNRFWNFFPENRSSSTVTNLSVTVDSGYSPSLFDWSGPVASFPVTKTLASLDPGGVWDTGGGLNSTISAHFTAGYDSTRSVNPSKIPAGGGQQTVTVTVTPQDLRYKTLVGQFSIILDSNVPGVTVASWTGPSNLNQGETFFTGPNGLLQWQLLGVQVAKKYQFTATLNVPNSTGKPFVFRPSVSIRGALEANLGDNAGTTVRIADPTLDGATPGRGGSTFSVSETGHTWTLVQDEAADVTYNGTPGQHP